MFKTRITDVAKLANVSISTVSKVMNKSGTVDPDIVQRVSTAADTLGYHPDVIAQSMKRQKTKTVGVIVDELSNGSLNQIINSIEPLFAAKDYALIIKLVDSPETQEKAINALLSRRVDGIIAVIAGKLDVFVKYLGVVPIIFANRRVDDYNVDFVCEDSESVTTELISYLVSVGHKKIAIINGILDTPSGMEKYIGYKTALKKYGIPFDNKYVLDANIRSSQTFDTVLVSTARHIKSYGRMERPTAYFSTDELRTELLLRALSELKVKVPNDCSIASYGRFCTEWLLPYTLTYISHDMSKISRKASEILLNKLERTDVSSVIQHIIQPKTVIGNSVSLVVQR